MKLLNKKTSFNESLCRFAFHFHGKFHSTRLAIDIPTRKTFSWILICVCFPNRWRHVRHLLWITQIRLTNSSKACNILDLKQFLLSRFPNAVEPACDGTENKCNRNRTLTRLIINSFRSHPPAGDIFIELSFAFERDVGRRHEPDSESPKSLDCKFSFRWMPSNWIINLSSEECNPRELKLLEIQCAKDSSLRWLINASSNFNSSRIFFLPPRENWSKLMNII